MTEEVKQLLEDYFSAASNLYGLIPVRKLLGIYNSQNDPVTEEDFEEFLERFECKEGFYDIIGEDEILTLMSLHRCWSIILHRIISLKISRILLK